ncbi:MAG: hypothetical protein ACXV5B_02570, partial [Halobacteriota archaeon]
RVWNLLRIDITVSPQIITLASVTYGKVYRITYEATERFLSHCLVFPATTISHIRLIILFFPIIVTVPFWWPRMIALLNLCVSTNPLHS